MAPKRNYINVLPDEVLCMIFDRLDLQSVKNVSRTCRRFNNTIFLSAYVDRFQFVMSANSPAVSKKNPMKSLEERIKLIARHTKRRYRTFTTLMVKDSENAHINVWKVIHPKITSNIRTLHFTVTYARITEILPMIIADIPSMLQLQELHVLDDCLDPYSPLAEIGQQDIPTIRSKSLKVLLMTCNYKYTVDLPQLEGHGGALSAVQAQEGSPQPLVFSKMKQLGVTVNSWKPIDPSFFQNMPCLEFIQWDAPLQADLLINMYEMCPLVKKLNFARLCRSDIPFFKHVLKMNQLRMLTVGDINVDQDVFFDFSKLTHLEEFYLRSCKVMPFSFLSLSKSLSILGLSVNLNNEQTLLQIISCNLTRLRKLYLVRSDFDSPKHVLNVLPHLKQLEALTLSYSYISKSFFFGMNEPLYSLLYLELDQCKLATQDLFGLQENFPNLKKLKFDKCFIDMGLGCYQTIDHTIDSPFAL